MLGIPFHYNVRNLFVRKTTTGLTVLGIGLVVAIFLCVMALAEGLANVFHSSGSPLNVIVLRKNAQAELQSQITREQATLLSAMKSIQRDNENQPLFTAEMLVIVNLDKRDGGTANIPMRGVGPKAMAMRPKMKLTEGRMFVPGMSEVIVSESIAKRFKGCEVGDTIAFGSLKWKVVGHFDAEGTAPNSEVWGDVEGLMNDFKRTMYQSILIRVPDRASKDDFIATVLADAQLKLDPRPEMQYYEEQTATAEPIKFLGMFIAVIMAVGACFGAMNTMYAAVSARTREIATLRALGFSRLAIMVAFVTESTILGFLGGVVGCILGVIATQLAFSGVKGTMNFSTFSEVVFAFRLTPKLMMTGLLFSIAMGFFGGLLPAWRAATTKITVALRQVA